MGKHQELEERGPCKIWLILSRLKAIGPVGTTLSVIL